MDDPENVSLVAWLEDSDIFNLDAYTTAVHSFDPFQWAYIVDNNGQAHNNNMVCLIYLLNEDILRRLLGEKWPNTVATKDLIFATDSDHLDKCFRIWDIFAITNPLYVANVYSVPNAPVVQ